MIESLVESLPEHKWSLRVIGDKKKRRKPKTRTEVAADNRKMVIAFRDAWDGLNVNARRRIAEVAYGMLPSMGQAYVDGNADPMDQPFWRHVCYAIIENLGLVKDRPNLWKSFTGNIVDTDYWDRYGETPAQRIAAVNARY